MSVQAISCNHFAVLVFIIFIDFNSNENGNTAETGLAMEDP